MKTRETSLSVLIRKSAFGGLAVVAAAVAVLFWCHGRYTADNRNQTENVRKEQLAKRHLASLSDELAAINLASASYTKLLEDGVLGDLNKTRLLDQIEAALMPFGDALQDYKLDGYKEFSRPALSGLNRHKFGLHRLQVNFKPLHEGEFMQVWRALAGSSSGVIPIESCDLIRTDKGVDGNATLDRGSTQSPAGSLDMSATNARLEARCVLNAYSIRFEAASNGSAASPALAASTAPGNLKPIGSK